MRERRHASVAVVGHHVQRSSRGTDRPYAEDRRCLLVAGAGAGGDGGDGGDGGGGDGGGRLAVELHGGGHPLVVGRGRHTCADDGSGWRRPVTGTAAGPPVTVDRRTVPGLDVLVARAGSPCCDAVHTRTVVLVDGDYWLVHDRLRAAAPHRYVARWQLAPAAAGHVLLERADDQVGVRAPGVALVVPRGPAAVTVADGSGMPHRAPAVQLVAEGRPRVDLFTAVLPTGSVPTAPDVRVAAVCRADAVRAWVQRPGIGVDRVRWTIDGRDAQWRRERC